MKLIETESSEYIGDSEFREFSYKGREPVDCQLQIRHVVLLVNEFSDCDEPRHFLLQHVHDDETPS